MMNHGELHQRAVELALKLSVPDLETRIAQGGGKVIRRISGRFGGLQKFSEYSPHDRTIIIYGTLSEPEERMALAHEWLHLVQDPPGHPKSGL